MTTWIFLRGLTRASGHWGSFITLFEQALPGSRVVALDFPGNGQLSGRRSPTQVAGMVADCRTQLAQRKLQPPYRLLAMSLGAMVAVQWAQSYPQEVASNVLINTSMRPYNRFYQRLRPASYAPLLKLMLWGGTHEAWERTILRLTSNQGRVDVLPDWVALRQANSVSRRNALAQLIAAARYHAPAQRPAVPTLLLVSEQDRLVASACSRALAQRWQCEWRQHPSAGHDLPLDDGPWVVEQVRDWLRTLA